MSDSSNIFPHLRFPEFSSSGYSEIQIGDLGTFATGGTPSKEREEFWHGKIPWISSSDIDEEFIADVKVNRFISESALAESTTKLIPKDSVLIVSRVGVGKIGVSGIPLCTSQDFISLTPSKANHLYVAYYLKSIRSRLLSLSQGMAIQGFTKEDLSKVIIQLPLASEQQKIADCLSSLDELIAAEAERLEALRAHKKGLMQVLFPAEEERVPKVRFKGFGGEWNISTIGARCDAFSGGTPSTTNRNYYGGEIPFIRSAEIAKDRTELTLTQAGLENSSAKLVSKGDILFALYGANSGDVSIAKIHGAINQAVLCLRTNGSNEFIYHFLSHKKESIITSYIQGGQGNLSGEIVKSIELPFPSLDEQQKIAACLSSVDELIAEQEARLEGLRAHKKGLMQGLFVV